MHIHATHSALRGMTADCMAPSMYVAWAQQTGPPDASSENANSLYVVSVINIRFINHFIEATIVSRIPCHMTLPN